MCKRRPPGRGAPLRLLARLRLAVLRLMLMKLLLPPLVKLAWLVGEVTAASRLGLVVLPAVVEEEKEEVAVVVVPGVVVVVVLVASEGGGLVKSRLPGFRRGEVGGGVCR